MKSIGIVIMVAFLFSTVTPVWAGSLTDLTSDLKRAVNSPDVQYVVISGAMTVVALLSGALPALLVPVAVWYGYYKCFREKTCEPLGNPGVHVIYPEGP